MKKTILLLVMLLTAIAGQAQEMKTLVVTTTPQMHCDGCEKKIKGNLRFEKGVKKIVTSIPNQTVTIEYDAGKTSADRIIDAFPKFGYKAEELKKGQESCEGEKGDQCEMKGCCKN